MAESARLTQIREWIAESPEDPELQYALAMEYRSAGEDELAIDSFRKLIAVKPDFVPCYLMLAQSFVHRERTDEARAVLRDGIAAARRAGQDHAQGELQTLLDSLD